MDLLCEIDCAKAGGRVPTCCLICGGDPQTVQAALCVAQNCGVGTSFRGPEALSTDPRSW
jgi:hypothetical protein